MSTKSRPYAMKPLPQEIWRDVFIAAYRSLLQLSLENNHADSIALAMRIKKIGHRERLIMTLSTVCKAWRDIVESTSALWTDLSCPLTTNGENADNASALRHLQKGIRLSRHRTLSIRIFMYGLWDKSPSCDIALDAVSPHMGRVRHFKIVYVRTRPDGRIIEGATSLVIPQLAPEYINSALAEARSLFGGKAHHPTARRWRTP
ncbi:hypothetical protein CALCODRAFT_497052 [Calocera cornea HHB12733]|uniref:F-box domain-containing protein n=1 Tax=Calocera cornea HHB12733 TaxID=1353952 RepID=A0A165FGZ9_9BASI|nr:hypothetical protein CALCODRAFT_497052 [Calocera cornea HHB12733]